MKTLLHILLLLIPIIAFPQGTPQGISYQAVAYDSDGFELSNKDISVRLGILLGGVDAEASYSEVHSVTTDDFGLFSLVISEGETSDTFSSINWEEGAYLKVEVDEDLDGEYSVMGVSSFNSVPYALYAPTDYRVDSLVSLFENKIGLITRPIQESLDLGYTLEDLISVGINKDRFIGLRYQGGYLGYIDESGLHGYIISYNSIGQYAWGCIGTEYDIHSSDGLQNSLNIVSVCSDTLTAAYQCLSYESGGYSDWFLGSILEYRLINKSLGHSSKYRLDFFGQSSNYFTALQLSSVLTSSETAGFQNWYGDDYAATYNFINFYGIDNQLQYQGRVFKDYDTTVRPIRSF